MLFLMQSIILQSLSCRYRVEGEDCNTYCTYFRKVYDSVEIIAFLYEAGECKTDVESLLSVRRCSNE